MSYSLGKFLDSFSNLGLDDEPAKIKANFNFLNEIGLHINYSNGKRLNFTKVFEKESLVPHMGEYYNVNIIFKHTMFNGRNVNKIERIENPFLYAQYQLSMLKKKWRYGSVKELTLFHGTKSTYIDSICKNNFDWRKMGRHGFRYRKFGRRMSFSPSARYASDYPRRCHENPRIMFVVKVLEGSRCLGVPDLVIPPEPHDTSAKSDGDVVVKYFDNEFYPEYIISYT
ncbi:protein mono-ADP-ribosyltransferase PARP12-like [Leptinotarsa decemlineata]|uniref:protein mono-ADP-ribosyltransferase PARP12-like n=1 Tax=Leptinotarsa decemlineata TaxID=7539 RepID=UPI003D30C48D